MPEIIIKSRTEHLTFSDIRAEVREGDITLSKGHFTLTESTFASTRIKTLLAGGIATPVHFRRGGNVRKMFEYIHEYAVNEGAAVSLLHPFSFSYYNKFGYEKVADHLIVRFPTRMIDFVPRECNFVPFDNKMLPDVIAINEKFAKGRNLLLPKYRIHPYAKEKLFTYVCYDGNEPIAYLTYTTRQKLMVNHYVDGVITVHELAYTSPKALREIFSFLKMFEGEFDEVEFANLSPCPEADILLRHYTHTKYELLPDIMARILNTESLLLAQDYPKQNGEFTLKILDTMPTVAGVYKVCYGNGEKEVRKLSDSADADMTLGADALVRLIYGYDGIGASEAEYIEGIKINNDPSDFFRAFPKRPCGMFEHF